MPKSNTNLSLLRPRMYTLIPGTLQTAMLEGNRIDNIPARLLGVYNVSGSENVSDVLAHYTC